MLSRILVYGWYFHGNAGDDLFMDAFRKIFPQLNFTFTDNITSKLLSESDALFIGGGSFLEFPLKMPPELLNQVKQKPIFYIGVGAETALHSMHVELMKLAKLIAIRSSTNIDYLLSLNEQTIVIPDIVHSLSDNLILNDKIPQSVLILPNIAVVPKQQDAHWKHAAWDYFKSEFSQFLDHLVQENYSINFLSMCDNPESSDSLAAAEIVNRMNLRRTKYFLPSVRGIDKLSKVISSYDLIITQRFHGIILAEMLKVPYIAIYHHDKLKQGTGLAGNFISYYSMNKNYLLDNFKKTFGMDFKDSLPIERNIFKQLNQLVLDILSGEQNV